MPKKDYYDDPSAPSANSLVVAVAAVVQNDQGDVLMIERTDNGLWAIPGGAQDIGETTREAVIREVEEETGLRVEITGVTGIYSDPRHVIAYDDGEVRQEFSITFEAKIVGGNVRTSSESKRVEWVSPERIPSLNIHPSVRLRIDHALEDRESPYLS
ncbi:NUDIX hydrolase [Saccharopolyspora mangrovi]|uniref:NUDIX domain-containing protein n=1 Tax=Saccharopolyspora mangrovi TaxID=3082379 RepID=A0ABU6AF94_9PSEU|nr:NUDIX domain-containing protein [Saccharopolyspora sp. S2-29]MEB3370211.1 NUDIX domain-containing protein [Saccharopolyspora sp. S2-29]